jgi:hypothetical protein
MEKVVKPMETQSVTGRDPISDNPAVLLGTAEQALASGDFHRAIDLLSAANRCGHSSAIEQRLIELRIRAAQRLAWPETPWSGHYDNRFESVVGFPEVGRDELDASVLRAGILGKGGLIVRGLMDQGLAAMMRENIAHTLQSRKLWASGKPGAGDSRWYTRSEAVAGGPVQFDAASAEKFTDTGSVWAVDSPPNAFRLIEFYRELGLPRILHEYFGEDALLSVKKWVLRCIAPNNGAQSGWHQDGRFMGEGIRTVNLWIALSDCGSGAFAPGLDIVADNSRKIYETGTHGADFDWTVGQGLVDEISQRFPVIRPHFSAGDAVFFDHYNLHRTGFGLEDRENRYAVESWFFSASTAPEKQQPLVF